MSSRENRPSAFTTPLSSDPVRSAMPPPPGTGSPDPAEFWNVRTRTELEALVRVRQESNQLEFKAHGDFRACGACIYCQARIGQTQSGGTPRIPAGAVVARAVASMANSSGG